MKTAKEIADGVVTGYRKEKWLNGSYADLHNLVIQAVERDREENSKHVKEILAKLESDAALALTTLRAENARLREALTPFGTLKYHLTPGCGDTSTVHVVVSAGDVRRAHEVMCGSVSSGGGSDKEGMKSGNSHYWGHIPDGAVYTSLKY